MQNYTMTTRRSTDFSEVLRGDLRRATYLGCSTHCGLKVYDFDGGSHSALMREVWRLRKLSFAGVGVELEGDDSGDRADVDGTCRQLIVWDDVEGRIVGGYRYALGAEVRKERLSLWRYFAFTPRFEHDYLPYAVELGRSFVAPDYQCSSGRNTIFALDALWEGLGRVVSAADVRYLFGRVTLYPSLGIRARNLLVGFMRYIFPPRDILISARQPFEAGVSRYRCGKIFVGETLQNNYKILLSRLRSMHRSVPPILSSYMRLSPSMQSFDCYRNNDLGGVAEMAIMLTVDDFYDDIKRRYLVL